MENARRQKAEITRTYSVKNDSHVIQNVYVCVVGQGLKPSLTGGATVVLAANLSTIWDEEDTFS